MEISKKIIFNFSFSSGVISSVGQIVLLRELMVQCNGNEITFAIAISSWLLFIALGTYLYQFYKGKFTIRKSFIFLTSIQILMLCEIIIIFLLPTLLNPLRGSLISFFHILIVTFVALLPSSLALGFYFPYLCKIAHENSFLTSDVYRWETIGMAVGGLIFYALISLLTSFQIFLLSFLLILIFLPVKRSILYYSMIIFFFVILFYSSSIFKNAYGIRYPKNSLSQTYDSAYGRLDIVKTQDQVNYYQNGNYITSSQNMIAKEMIVNFLLLQHPNPQKILIIGNLLQNYPLVLTDKVEHITYLEKDSNVLAYYKNRVEKDLHNCKILNEDINSYLKSAERDKFDIVFFDLPDPTTLNLNRYYTKEMLLKIQQLFTDKNSLIAITVSSGANFLTPQLARMQAILFYSVSNVYNKTTFLPSEQLLFLGSNGNFVSNQYKTLLQRSQKRNYQNLYFSEELIFDCCNQLRIDHYSKMISQKKVRINSNFSPSALVASLEYDHFLTGLNLQNWIITARKFYYFIIFFILVLTTILTKIFGKGNATQKISVFLVSLLAFLFQLIIMYSVQVHFGSLYYHFALFSISFMIGLWSGFSCKKAIPVIGSYSLLLLLELLVFFIIQKELPIIFWFMINLCVAFLEGTSLKMILQKWQNKSGYFYFLDSLGAALGGLLFVMLIIPAMESRLSFILPLTTISTLLIILQFGKMKQT